MFDDRLVFESPGKLPGQVRPENIRHTHFSRNPKIAAFLKAYHYVREFGEGVDRICRELEVTGAANPSFRTDEFILKITVRKVTENEQKQSRNRTEKLPENGAWVAEKLPEKLEKLPEKGEKVAEKLPENYSKVIEKVRERADSLGEGLTENKLAIISLMIEDPYITKTDIANTLGISYTAVGKNITAMRGKYLRRVGPDKGGFWEIIKDEEL